MADIDNHETIIVAEDSAPNRKILAHLLKKMGYDVIACEDGAEAWAVLTTGSHRNIVAVLTDVMMPKMDGMTLVKNIRESETLKLMPLVLITAVSDQRLAVEAAKLNVNGYILKPVTFSRVEQKMKELFPNKIFPKHSA